MYTIKPQSNKDNTMEKANVKKEDIGFMEEIAGQGYENIGQEDISTPYLKVAQALSPELDKEEDAYIEALEVGMFFNSLTSKVYGREINLIPVHYEKSWMEWKPDRGGLVGKHEPFSIQVDKTDFSKWKYGNNIISDTLMFYCFVEGHMEDGPLVYALTGSGIRHGKNWNTQIMMTKLPSGSRAPYFSSVWKLNTTKQKNEQGTWYQIGGKKSNIVRSRFITSKEYTELIAPIREDLNRLTSSVDYKQLESSGGTEVQTVDPNDVSY